MSKVLVTGANRGIGLELCKQLVGRGDEVIAVCRASSAELDALGVRVIDEIDVSSASSINNLKQKINGESLDWLINNAGMLANDSLHELDFDNIEKQFIVNSLGPLRVTSALLSSLSKGSKVGIVTSRMGSIDDNDSGGYYGYRISKAAVNMVGKNLACDLEGHGVAVALLHPGMVATEMTGKRGVPPQQAASGLIERLDALDLTQSGGFWHANGEVLPW
jgi:NAD(P)-dependent dehydrogenase (short-subunit alcohol dehydrogenase family)